MNNLPCTPSSEAGNASLHQGHLFVPESRKKAQKLLVTPQVIQGPS